MWCFIHVLCEVSIVSQLCTFSLPISLNSLDRVGVRLMSPHDSQITFKTRLQVPMIPCRWCTWAQGGARWRSCSLCCSVSSWSIVEPSWGDRGSVALGAVFFYFGSVVGPCLSLVAVMLYSCIVWSGDYKPTLYHFSYSVHGMCKDYPSCDIAFNAVMPLSRAPTRGRYSRIEGVTKKIRYWRSNTTVGLTSNGNCC